MAEIRSHRSLAQQIEDTELAVYRDDERIRERTAQLRQSWRSSARRFTIVAIGVAAFVYLLFPQRNALGRWVGRFSRSTLGRLLPRVVPLLAPLLAPFIGARRAHGGGWMKLAMFVLPLLFKLRSRPAR